MNTKTVRAFPSAVLLFIVVLLFVGTNECRSHSHPMPSQPTAPVISSWESPWHLSTEVSLAVARSRYRAVMNHARFNLHSQKPYQEVEIPLTIRNYHAYVQAKWSGQSVECMVDTGSSLIMWPQWLHLDAHQLDISMTNWGVAGAGVRGEWVLSPQIDIGNLTLVNVPTEAMGIPRPPTSKADFLTSSSTLQSSLTRPILGWFAFQPGVVTIDYLHKKLIVRNQDYDVTRQPAAQPALLIPYQVTSTGLIVLPGTLEGHKARFLLDTGCGWQVVSTAFAHKNLASYSLQTSVEAVKSDARETKPFVHSLAGDVGGLHFKALDFYVEEGTGEADVLIGQPFFLKYRITIDPFRKVVLLENNR